MSALAKERARARARKKAKASGGLATIAVSNQLLKRERKWHELAPAATVDAVLRWLHPKQWNFWRQGKSKGKELLLR